MRVTSQNVPIFRPGGDQLAVRLDRPIGAIGGTAIFVHQLDASDDGAAAPVIARHLTERGLQVLSVAFAVSDGTSGETSGAAHDLPDIVAIAAYLRGAGTPADLLIGHGVGGAAILAVAADIPEARAVAVIGTPTDAAQIRRTISTGTKDAATGEAPSSGLLAALQDGALEKRIGAMDKALLILHAPTDDVVGIDNASAIFLAAKHPKSFVSLDGADHGLARAADPLYVAEMIAAWAWRYIPRSHHGAAADASIPANAVHVSETGVGKFQQELRVGAHRLLADEPAALGGGGTGPTPYDLLAMGLGACTAMTLRLYADRRNIALEHVEVLVTHEKRHAEDLADCADCPKDKAPRIDRFDRTLRLAGDLSDEERRKLIAIADRCPVHRTLEAGAEIVTHSEPLKD